MKTVKLLLGVNLVLAGMSIISGCCRTPCDVWDDTKSCGRHVTRGVRALGGKHGDSRLVCCKDDFVAWDEEEAYGSSNPPESEYSTIPEDRAANDVAMADFVAPQPRETPGDPGSSIPGIEAFRDPATMPKLAGIFNNIHFEYNSNLVKGDDNLSIVRNIAAYLRQNPRTYIFVEGHADERGPEAYNLALGSRRSNAVRNLLIQEGVNPDNIFTISYGKERPLVLESNEDAWSQNRRAEFKVYQR